MSLAIQLAIAGILLVAGFGGGVKFHAGLIAQRDLAAKVEQERETLRRIDKVDTSAVKHEAAKTRIETEFVEVTKEVIRIVKEPFYVDAPMCLDPDGVRLINQAAGHAAPASGVASAAVRQPTATD
jgi:uncharacterized FAD-dependent dehydrogenase